MVRPSRGFRLVAVASAAAAWALVAVGGVVRVTESGLGCPDWPLCEGNVVPAGQKEPVLEFSHRATASVVTVLVVAVVAWALARHRGRRDITLPAIAAAALLPVQALLGAVAVWLEVPGWVVGVHFVVGMVFLGLTVAAAVAAARSGPRRATAGFARLAAAGLAAGLLLVSLGAAVVAVDAGHACGAEWPACNGGFAAGGSEAVLHATHRTVAYGVAALAVALAVAAWRGRGPRVSGSLPLAASLVQIGVGVALVLASGTAHDVLEALHVAGAGAVFAALAAASAAAGPPGRRALAPPTAVGSPARA